MKTTLLALALGTALVTGAQAADVYQRGSTKDGPDRDSISDGPVTLNWSGLYIGGRVGYGHSNHELSAEAYRNSFEACDGEVCQTIPGDSIELFNLNGLDSSGFTGGGQVGFDIQRGMFVGGVFGSYDFSNAETTISSAAFEIPEFSVIEQGDSWSIGARAGLLVNPRTLVYVLAAYTQTEFTFAGLGEDGADKDVSFNGITAGAGVEFALTKNIFMGIEGTHTFYDKETLADSCAGESRCEGGIRLSDEIGETKVMGTLKIKLNSGLPSFLDQ